MEYTEFIQYIEQARDYIINNWPIFVEYAILGFAYFLVFLFRAKVKGTKQDLTVMFKEKANEVTLTDKLLRKDVNDELTDAKKSYQDAVDEIDDLKHRLIRAENAIRELLADENLVDEVTDEIFVDEVNSDGE